MPHGPQSGPPAVSIPPARSPRNVKNDTYVLCVYQVFFQALKYAKTRFLPPWTPLGELTALPQNS